MDYSNLRPVRSASMVNRAPRTLMNADEGRIEEDCTKEDFFGGERGARAQLFLSKILTH